jgi:hypothetical protein
MKHSVPSLQHRYSMALTSVEFYRSCSLQYEARLVPFLGVLSMGSLRCDLCNVLHRKIKPLHCDLLDS